MTDTVTPPPFSEYDDDRTKAIEASMQAKGESTTEPVAVDYFDFEEEFKVLLPDGIQYFTHKVLNEGARRKYERQSQRDVKLQRATNDVLFRAAPGEARAALLETCITGWYLVRNRKSFPYSKTNVATVLEVFPPKIIDIIHKDIMQKNPWLLADMTVEDIDRELETLQEQRAIKVAEEAGKEN